MLVVLVAGLLIGLMVPRLWASDVEPGPPRIHVVSSGETLWGLANTYAGDDDPRRFIYELRRLNGLEGPEISPGDELRIP